MKINKQIFLFACILLCVRFYAVATTSNSCKYAFDGECDEPQHCQRGTDTYDCNTRRSRRFCSGRGCCSLSTLRMYPGCIDCNSDGECTKGCSKGEYFYRAKCYRCPHSQTTISEGKATSVDDCYASPQQIVASLVQDVINVDGEICSNSNECSGNKCLGGRCCNTRGSSTGTVSCNSSGDSSRCAAGYYKEQHTCYVCPQGFRSSKAGSSGVNSCFKLVLQP